MTTMTADQGPSPVVNDSRFFLNGAIAMTLVIVAGFSMQLAAGRSSFASPPLVHAHAIVFMGWVAIYLTQNVLAGTGRIALHRKLGWLAAAWMVPMLVLGFAITIAMVRKAGVPFFFKPLHFLIFNPLSLVTFIGLSSAAIVMRRRTDWHRRLHFCGMTLLLGPGFGRLLPMPLLIPYAWETTMAVGLLFPLAGVVADLRRTGRVHPAWIWGLAAILGYAAVTQAITYSPLGQMIYDAASAGSAGANAAALGFPPPPPMP